LSSSHSDGNKSASLSYTLDWDGNLDETITVSGSSKVGNWTASGNVSYNRDRPGCIDNGTNSSATSGCAAQTAEDRTAVTVTDGTMTIVLGEAGHLSNQNASSGSQAAGAVSFDPRDDDIAVGAFVDSFHGVSLGYKINDGMSATVAYQKSSEANDMCGAGEYIDGEAAGNSGTSTTGTGLGFNGTFGPAAVGVTVCNASTEDVGAAAVDPSSLASTSSTMGLGVKVDLGDIKPFLSYGTYKNEGSSTKDALEYSGNEVGLTYALGSDTVILYIGSYETTSTDAGTAGNPYSYSGMEVGYNTTVGPASLKVGYGTQTRAQTGGTYDGYSMTDIEVAMSYSF
jgi:predicted porin